MLASRCCEARTRGLAAVACLSVLIPTIASAQGGVTATTQLQWVAAPSILPPGAQIAVVSGDPTGPGQATIQLLMPGGYSMPPLYHPTDERVEVRQGTLLVGMGEKLDAKKTLPLSVGDTIVAPARFHHDYEAPRQRTPFAY